MLEHVGSAFRSIASNKVRSLLTMLGVVIGVTSVTTLVALGQGLQKDVSNVVEGFGSNVIAVLAGKIDTESSETVNPAAFISGDILTLSDVEKLKGIPGVEVVSPISLVAANVKNGEKTASPIIFGANPDILKALELLEMGEGRMYNVAEERVVVLSATAKKTLFGDGNALGQTVLLGKEEYGVIGVLKESSVKNALSNEYDNITLLPFDEAKRLNKDQVKITRIIAKAGSGEDVTAIRDEMKSVMLAAHDGEENFSVLTQDDLLDLFGTFLSLATAMVSAIAAISLVVGGIGIMNIMLVTVTERTREIGLRKAVGAPSSAILVQFLTEAVAVTLVGGAIGLGISFTIGAIVTAKTELTPVFSPQVILLALGISTLIGILFGLWPALRAAKKDPIEALRYE